MNAEVLSTNQVDRLKAEGFQENTMDNCKNRTHSTLAPQKNSGVPPLEMKTGHILQP
jgi:hypothetical protein